MPTHCSSCQATLSPDARFCPSCGARVMGGASPDELNTVTRPTAAFPRPTRGGALSMKPGQRLGRHRLTRLLGRGGFGEVWEAELEDGRRVALKVLTARAASSEQVERFKREGRLAASLSHPNCVYVFGAEEVDGLPVISMELMPGGTLQDRLKEEGVIPFRRAVDYTLQIVDGLEAAAAAGVVHRDVKPSNCFLDRQGSARIGDFGLSKALDLDSELTAAGAFMGTPAYCSPEQVKGREVDSSSDLYSVGATLYALLTGRPPFSAEGGAQVLARILSEPPTPFSEHAAQVPRGLQRVVLRLLAKEKSRRYPSYAALRAALRPYASRGLARAGLGGRLVALVVDSTLVQVALGLTAGREYLLEPLTLFHQLAALVVTLAYFGVQEWLWGRTLGKRLLGLRVVDLEGGSPALDRIVLRVGVFAATLYAPIIARLTVHPATSSHELSANVLFWTLGIALPYAVLLATMRRRNDFAGLHDLASRTRVMVAAPSRSSVPEARSQLARGAEPSPEAFPPYRDVRILWSTAGESLLLARDPELRRDVWIHAFRREAAVPVPSELAVDRPGRLHWLHRSRGAHESWDVYEAPSGLSLFEWVAARGRLPWAKVREILLDMAVELEARREQAGATPQPSIRHVWVDGHGQTRLLDFPAQPRAGGQPPGPPSGQWRAFLQQVLLFTCEGRLVDPDALGTRTPHVPLPEHARPLLRRLCGWSPAPPTAGALVPLLREVAARPPAVTRMKRLGPLFLTSLPGLLMLFTLTVAALGAPETMRLAGTLRRSGAALERLAAAGGPEQEARGEALRLLRAHTYGRLQAVIRSAPDPVAVRVATGALDTVGADERSTMEALLKDRRPSRERLAAARRELEALRPSASLWGLSLGFLLYGIAPLGIPALILAPLVRGGALLALFGVALQTSNGERAGRTRSLLRAVVVWAPILLFRLWQPWIVLHVAFPLVLAAGVGYALARPDRGVADLIAGTHLVPR